MTKQSCECFIRLKECNTYPPLRQSRPIGHSVASVLSSSETPPYYLVTQLAIYNIQVILSSSWLEHLPSTSTK